MKKNCFTCGTSIDPVLLVNCDDCKSSFHRQCIITNANDIETDLIRLCASCVSENQICVDGDSVKNTNDRNTLSKVTDKRMLRNGKVLKSNIPIKANRKHTRNANESQTSKIINAIAKNVHDLKNHFMSMERRLTELESNATHSGSHEYHEIDEKIEILNSTIKNCEELLQSNDVRNRRIEKEFKEMGHKLKNEITVRIDESWRIRFMENELKKIKQTVERMHGQLNGMNSQSSEINEHEFSYEIMMEKKQSCWQDLDDISSIGTDEIASKETTAKTTTLPKPSMLHYDASKSKKQIWEKKAAGNRFTKPYDSNEYTRTLLVEIRETDFVDLQQHRDDFKRQFSTHIGRDILKNATITGYRLKQDIITSIRYAVEFEIPLNFQYLDDLKFPMNWYFYGMKRSNNRKRSTQY